MSDWLDLLRSRVDQLGSIVAVARELGYSRTSISTVLSGNYPAKTTALQNKVVATYTRCDCPYLGRELTAIECRRFRTRPLPQSRPDELRHWSSCQRCPIGQALTAAESAAGGSPC